MLNQEINIPYKIELWWAKNFCYSSHRRIIYDALIGNKI